MPACPIRSCLATHPSASTRFPLAGCRWACSAQRFPLNPTPGQLTLDPGDVLLIASDGLGEIRPSGDEQFQDKAQRAAFAELTGRDGHEVIQGLIERAREFNGGDHYDDDLTLLAITKT